MNLELHEALQRAALAEQALAYRDEQIRDLRQELIVLRGEHARRGEEIAMLRATLTNNNFQEQGDRIERLIHDMQTELRQLHGCARAMWGDLYGMQAEFRQVVNYARHVRDSAVINLNQTNRLVGALADTARRAIVDPLKQDLQPTIVFMDVSDCPSQRLIYDPNNKWPRLIKMVEGQAGRHVKKTVNELREEGGHVLREVEYNPNGITHRHNVKRTMEELLDEVCAYRLHEMLKVV